MSTTYLHPLLKKGNISSHPFDKLKQITPVCFHQSNENVDFLVTKKQFDWLLKNGLEKSWQKDQYFFPDDCDPAVEPLVSIYLFTNSNGNYWSMCYYVYQLKKAREDLPSYAYENKEPFVELKHPDLRDLFCWFVWIQRFRRNQQLFNMFKTARLLT